MLRKNLDEYKENIFQDLGKKGEIGRASCRERV